jgi:hypothetical protein
VPKVLDFSVPKRWGGWWRVLDVDGVLLCRVRAKNYDAAVLKARNRSETAGKAFMVVPDE